jgi:hypothetical protein
MPKEIIDYSNTIIYKIVCNDINITDTYVGHTTNFVQRKHAHKQGVNNPKCSNYHCKLYKFIRSHGGWANWSMIIVAFKNCTNNYEACALEHEYYKELNANLNSVDPCKPMEIIEKKEDIIEYKYICDHCDFKNNNKYEFNKHMKHHSECKKNMCSKTLPTVNYLFFCDKCQYGCNAKSDYNKHLLTKKHNAQKCSDNCSSKNTLFICDCKRSYKHIQSFNRHKKTCNFEKENISCEIIENEDVDYKDLVITLIKENNDIKEIMKKQQDQLMKQQDQISELMPKIGNTINNNNTNNKFNINVFLNEHCKDAMSINDFVKSIQVSLKNLLTTKSKGLGNGINEIINENMNKLSLEKRPVHCTDKKRETLYVKHDKWEKDINKKETTKMLKGLQLQQIKNLDLWKEANPNYMEDEDLKHEYMILVNKCTKPLSESEKKLFKNLCDNTYIKDDDNLIT